MPSWTVLSAPKWFQTATASEKGWVNPVTGEVLVAINHLQTKATAATADIAGAVTFTATYNSAAALVTGDVLTVTVVPSEPVAILGSPFLNVTIGLNTRQAVFDPVVSDGDTLVFKYTVVAGDAAIAGGVSVEGDIKVTGGAKVLDIVAGVGYNEVTTRTFVAPDTSAVTVN